jgi:diacylglycerol kinase (ATP)
MRVLLLTNPAAGGSRDGRLGDIANSLGRLGPVTSCSPGKEDFERQLQSSAEATDLLVVAGGDGTFHYALNALADRLDTLVFALIPMGTGNDLARTLDVPADVVTAAEAIVAGTERAVDIGRASGAGVEALFANACIGGFPVEVDEAVDPETKRRLGPLAYWVAGAKAATSFARFTVEMDEMQIHDCIAIGVGNGKTCGGGLRVWPDAEPDDGVLDACALAASSLRQALTLGAKVRAGTHVDLDEVTTRRGATIVVRADPEIEFNVDGELIGLKSPVTFSIARRMKIRAAGH